MNMLLCACCYKLLQQEVNDKKLKTITICSKITGNYEKRDFGTSVFLWI